MKNAGKQNLHHQYCSLSYISNISTLKTERHTTKKHFIKANIYQIHFVLICCISFSVPKL